MNTYKSNYSNEVHQLIISPSRHYYVTKSGNLKYQKKPIEINLKQIPDSKINNIVHYLIRDHYSGLFYWEICSVDFMFSVCDFLYRAWSKKENHPLCGFPDFLTIPKNVQVFFPNLLEFIDKLGITYIQVTSGFQGGVRDIKTVENELSMAGFNFTKPLSFTDDLVFERVLERIPTICNRIIDSSITRPTKKAVWEAGFSSDYELFIPNNFIKFEELYKSL